MKNHHFEKSPKSTVKFFPQTDHPDVWGVESPLCQPVWDPNGGCPWGLSSMTGACLPGVIQVVVLSPCLLMSSGIAWPCAATSCESAKVAVRKAFLAEGCLPLLMALRAGPLLGGWCGRTGHCEASFLACLVACAPHLVQYTIVQCAG